jgi:hypothetical protein
VKVVYIAAPFTAATTWDIECNVRLAEGFGLEVAKLGAMPLIPHCNSRFFFGQCTAEFWYEGTLELLKRCDAALFCGLWSVSNGCIRERAWCDEYKLPYFRELDPKLRLSNLEAWLRVNA